MAKHKLTTQISGRCAAPQVRKWKRKNSWRPERLWACSRMRTRSTTTSELLAARFEDDQISLLAGEKTIVEKLGHKYERIEELEDDPESPRILYRAFDNKKTVILEASRPSERSLPAERSSRAARRSSRRSAWA